MRARNVVLPLALLALGGCKQLGGGGGAGGRVHQIGVKVRPIVVVLSQKKNGNDCEAKYGNTAQHAFNEDVIAWEFVNNCDADQPVEVSPRGNNPFTSTPPWNKPIKAGQTDSIALVIGDATAAPPGTYQFNIKVAGKLFDPKLEIDP